MLKLLSIPQLQEFYPQLNKLLSHLIEEDGVTFSSVFSHCLSGQSGIWYDGNVAIVGEIISTIHNKEFVLTYAAGKMNNRQQILATLKTFARDKGCNKLTIYCKTPARTRYFEHFFNFVKVCDVLENKI